MFKAFLIKYGEIGIKGRNRYIFEDALMKQIRFSLQSVQGEFLVSKESGRIYVETVGEYDYDETISALQRVFGIVGISPVVQIEDKGFKDLTEQIIQYMNVVYPDKNKTFNI